ncbi:hypothetical protein NQZ68_012128 [Dissostichus eleginoides]|nr:hypothetical protein NQZ68_012128 [Dissostichus eleginoides]
MMWRVNNGARNNEPESGVNRDYKRLAEPSGIVPWLVKSGLENRGDRETGRRRWGTVCRTWLFRSVDPIRRVVTCLVRGHVPPERHAGGPDSANGNNNRACVSRVNTAELASEACLTVSTHAVLDYMCRETGNMRKSQEAAADGTRSSPGTFANDPLRPRPLIQIPEEDEGCANRMRTDRIDGRIFAVSLEPDSR